MANYIHGNVVKKHDEQSKEISQRVRTNRSKAQHMNKGYVIFLAFAAMLALFACVQYLRLQSDIMNRSKNINTLQREYADLKEANTTKYNAIMNSINLEEIREYAMNELHMVYATEDQIVKYQNPEGNTTVKYAIIPSDGISVSVNPKK